MSSDNETPVETFKRATAATLRAMSGQDEVEVNFSNDAPSVVGKRVRIPNPARDLNPRDAAIARDTPASRNGRKTFADASSQGSSVAS